MVIWQRTHGTPGWEARVNFGDSSFAAVEPCDGHWQVRFFRGMSDLGPYPVSSLARGQALLKRFGDQHARKFAFASHRNLAMRPHLAAAPVQEIATRYRKRRARAPAVDATRYDPPAAPGSVLAMVP
jgi:hypothetical protein